jgi:hypothetical protein
MTTGNKVGGRPLRRKDIYDLGVWSRPLDDRWVRLSPCASVTLNTGLRFTGAS